MEFQDWSIEGAAQEGGRELGFMDKCVHSQDSGVQQIGCARHTLWIWFREQGIVEAGAAQAIRLCEKGYLLSQPKPRSWSRQGSFGTGEHCRYLWYKHAARILGWCERKQFPEIVTQILRTHIFTSSKTPHEEACPCSAVNVCHGALAPHSDTNIGLSSNVDDGMDHFKDADIRVSQQRQAPAKVKRTYKPRVKKQVRPLLCPSNAPTPLLSAAEGITWTQNVATRLENLPARSKTKRTYKPRAKKQVSAPLGLDTGTNKVFSMERTVEDIAGTQIVPTVVESLAAKTKPKRTYKPRAKKQVSASLGPDSGTEVFSMELTEDDIAGTQIVPTEVENFAAKTKPKRTYKPRAKKRWRQHSWQATL